MMDGWIDRLLLNSLCCFIFLLTLFHFFLSLPFLFILSSLNSPFLFHFPLRLKIPHSAFSVCLALTYFSHQSSLLISFLRLPRFPFICSPPLLSSFLTNCPPVVSSPRPLHFFRLVSSRLVCSTRLLFFPTFIYALLPPHPSGPLPPLLSSSSLSPLLFSLVFSMIHV